MGLSPGLHPQAVGRPPEVVSALGRGPPAPLAGGLAGLAASRLTAIPLVVAVARVGIVQLAAVAALASSGSGHGQLQKSHRPSWRPPRRDPRNLQWEEDPQTGEEDKCAPGGKKTHPKKTTFSNRPNHYTFRTTLALLRRCTRNRGNSPLPHAPVREKYLVV